MFEAPSQFHLSYFPLSPLLHFISPTVNTAAPRNVNFPLGESLHLTLHATASSSVSALCLLDPSVLECTVYLHLSAHTHTHSFISVVIRTIFPSWFPAN